MKIHKHFAKTIHIAIIIAATFLLASETQARQLNTNTATVNSKDMGIALTDVILARFAQDGSGTVAAKGKGNYFPINTPGAFTNAANGCIAKFADFGFGNDCNKGGNDPQTAPSDPKSIRNLSGVITSVMSMELQVEDPKFSIGGNIDFTMNGTTGKATLSQFVTQRVDLDNGTSSDVTIDNRKNGKALTFEASKSSIYADPKEDLKPMNIPWSLSIDQIMMDGETDFHTASSGIYVYDVEKHDVSLQSAYRHDGKPCANLGTGPGAGDGDSCWPQAGSFDLPGFDMSNQGLGNGKGNFPGWF